MGGAKTSSWDSPKRLLESVADLLCQVPSMTNVGFSVRCNKNDVIQEIGGLKREEYRTFLDAVRCVRDISTSYLEALEDGSTAVQGSFENVLQQRKQNNDPVDTLLENFLSGLVHEPSKLSDRKLNQRIDALLCDTAFDNSDIETTADEEDDAASGDTLPNEQAEQSDDIAESADGTIQESIEGTAIVAPRLPANSTKKRLQSAIYVARKRTVEHNSYATPEDEYHDDDDPGYRIREIYEAELLEELKHTQPLQPTPEEEREEEEAAARKAAEEEKEKAAQSANNSIVVVSPHFGTGNKEASKEITMRKVPWFDPIKPAVKTKGASGLPNIKYKASNDRFYPVDMQGVVYDCFSLRIVHERDRTGFEETKEFQIRMGSIIAARYQVIEYLGSAAFSRAVQCLDLETNQMVCMKIIKNDKDFLDQSLDEIKLLNFININGNVDDHNCLRLIDYFYHKEHLILVTELLKDNLYEFSKYNRESGDTPYFTKARLQVVSREILQALKYIHGLKLIHCDLKPENILMKSFSRTEVKVIDFGSSCFVDDHLSTYVQSRSYRAPEVMLGLPYSEKIDIWSLGCILAELWTGYVLFQNDSVPSLLARILGIVGDFPYAMMAKGKHVPQFFTQDGRLYQEINTAEGIIDERGRPLHLLVPKRTTLSHRLRLDEDDPFLDFIRTMLILDPAKRPSAEQCLKHPFLTDVIYEEDEED